MSVLEFLRQHLSEQEFYNVQKEDFDPGLLVLTDDGLLTVLVELFDWTSSAMGYDYWYCVAHKEHNGN